MPVQVKKPNRKRKYLKILGGALAVGGGITAAVLLRNHLKGQSGAKVDTPEELRLYSDIEMLKTSNSYNSYVDHKEDFYHIILKRFENTTKILKEHLKKMGVTFKTVTFDAQGDIFALDNNNKTHSLDNCEIPDNDEHLQLGNYVKFLIFKESYNQYKRQAGSKKIPNTGKTDFSDVIIKLQKKLEELQEKEAKKSSFGKSKKIQELPLKRLKADLKFLKQKSI